MTSNSSELVDDCDESQYQENVANTSSTEDIEGSIDSESQEDRMKEEKTDSHNK